MKIAGLVEKIQAVVVGRGRSQFFRLRSCEGGETSLFCSKPRMVTFKEAGLCERLTAFFLVFRSDAIWETCARTSPRRKESSTKQQTTHLRPLNDESTGFRRCRVPERVPESQNTPSNTATATP